MADSPDSMRFLDNRLASFEKSAHPAKKHQSSHGKSIPREWPHETPTPTDLAAAGFYFNPMAKSTDNVSCFVCKVNLGGWEIDDVAIKEHIALAGSCPWATARSVAQAGEDRDPMSEQLLEARIATFAHWPHETKKRFKGKAKRMAENGWCLEPSAASDDATTCFYCDLALEGWKATEDPAHEHQKRSPNCPFYLLCDQYAALRPKKARGRASSVSRASRLSTQSIQSTFSEAPSLMSLGEPVTALEGDTSIGTVTSTTSTAKGKRKAPASKGRGKKKVVREPSIDDTEAATALTHLDESVAPLPSRLQETQIEESVVVVDQSEITTKPAAKKAPRARAAKGKTAATKQDVAESVLELTQPLEEQPPVESTKANTRAKRGKKRTSDGEEKAQEAHEVSIAPSVVGVPVKAKPARAPRGKKAKAAAEEQSQIEPRTDAMDIDAEEAIVEDEPAKPKKGRKAKAIKQAKAPSLQTQPEPEPVINLEPEEEVILETEPVEAIQDPEFVADENMPEDEAEDGSEANYQVLNESSGNIVVLDHTATIDEEHEPSPTPQRPRARAPSSRQVSQAKQPESAASTPRSVRSTQSSDAENHPPPSSSAAMSFSKQNAASTAVAPALSAFPAPPQLSPSKTRRVPLAAQTPNRSPQRVQQSPHKLGLLKSTTPWTATDIELVFAQGIDGTGEGQENAMISSGGVGEKLAELSGQLTSPEKKMTVEEWVRCQAGKGEQKLRDECERLVWLFEREGRRAMGVLDGVETAA